LVVLNEKREKVFVSIKRIVIFFVLMQIPIGVYRFLIDGQFEGNAGSLTNTSGSVSTIFPAVVSSYVFSLYRETRKLKYLLVIAGMIIFGLIGEKRAVTLFIPIVVGLVYILPLIKSRKIISIKTLSSFLGILFFAGVSFYFAVRMNPTLNKEGKIGGSFDYEYFVEYSKDYNKVGKHEDKSEMQRVEGFLYFNNLMLSRDWVYMLFGDGAGKLVSSRYSVNTSENLMLEYYNVRYGGRMGYVWLMMQVGYFGLFVYLGFFLSVFRRTWNRPSWSWKDIALLTMTIVFFLDTLFYSQVFIRYFYIMGLYMILIVSTMKDRTKRGISNTSVF
jgi:hypothetical protein